ncbi:ABC transporter permease [Clostridium sp. SHJSY1]|uniref:ABC transporter permease n=1 Tax=Clostridium sp. SHJSY1 TaxID=2942483 RepID=UPI0028766566|nr:ABC transporter permease [Clostridium sp. SHJSY1]MDS0526003.1 ABC transporter permease [Clostridium sp. SHJSY1]
MEFSYLVRKNIRYNIKKYIAYLIGNSLIQCILFMFFTLVYSKEFMESDKTTAIKSTFSSVIVFMMAFSVLFIVFTTMSFTKYRGKEFGVYFTIGLTWREIIKILCYENLIISSVSFVFASISGSLFSKLFQMAICRILKLDNVSITINIKVYVTILVISVFIYLFMILYQMVFLKRYSIVNILKSKSKKDVGSISVTLGIIGLMIFIVSIYTFKTALNKIINANIDGMNNLFVFSALGIVVAAYLLIGYFIAVIAKMLKIFREFYNNNILFVSSLSHRFISYRAVLFIVTLMVGVAVTFITIAYSTYISTKRQNDIRYPYDFSLVFSKEEIGNKNIKDFMLKNLKKVNNYNELEGVTIPNIRIVDNQCKWQGFYMLVISEANYKKISSEDLNLKKGEVLFSYPKKAMTPLNEDLLLDLTKSKINEIEVSLEDYKKNHKAEDYMYICKENIRYRMSILLNYNYDRLNVLVVNNEDYNVIKTRLGDEKVTYDVSINGILENDDYKMLKKKVQDSFGEKVSDSLIIKKELLEKDINENGFLLFVYSFMGMMLLIGSAAVLYFKAITDIEEDKERGSKLRKIGLSKREINKLSMQELGVIFFTPSIIGLVGSGYFLTSVFNIMSDGEYMKKNSLTIFIIYFIIQVIFYCLTSSKYKREINQSI